MKKVLLATAMTLALSATSAVIAGDDVLTAGEANTTALVGGNATAMGAASASLGFSNSGNQTYSNSGNAELSNAFNDVNSDNVTTIAEDGIVAHANDLNQAIAQADSKLTVAGNEVVMEGGLADASPLSPVTIVVADTTRTETNMMTGSFSHFSGISAVDQNIGSTSAVAQSVVIQSNGGI